MNTQTTTIRIDEELKKELDKIALDQNRSLNNLINTILMKYVEEIKKKAN